MAEVKDNVIPMPSTSERLVSRATQAMQEYAVAVTDVTNGTQRAIQAVVEYGRALQEGRDDNARNTKFSEWVSEHRLNVDEPWSDRRERTAAMAITKLVDGTGAVNTFAGCPNTRPTHIMSWWRKEHPEAVKKKPSQAAQTQKALDIIKTMVAQGEAITEKALVKRGVSAGTASKAYAVYRAEIEAAKQATAETKKTITEDQATTGFTDKQKVKFEEALRLHKARLEKTFEQRVGDEVRRRIAASDDEVRKQLVELRRQNLEYAKLIGKRGVFTLKEYRQLLMCCHPDNSASADVRNHIQDLLVKSEHRLVIPAVG
jgi:hypothetical protein